MVTKMTKKIFWENPYLTELQTKVHTVVGNQITVDETIFFAFSGGQESDHGTIGGNRVVEAVKTDNEIIYTLDDNHCLFAGDSVTIIIDWERRLKLMRLHFAAELILELVTRKLGIEKIGAHIAETKARIDFFYDKNIASIFPELLEEYNSIIANDKQIIKDYSDEINQRRYWEIEGFSKVPCGGTHVKSTSEVGYVTLKRVNIGGGKERIEIKLR
jgi:Ser-tRNA(Ala) deacylase AlaX